LLKILSLLLGNLLVSPLPILFRLSFLNRTVPNKTDIKKYIMSQGKSVGIGTTDPQALLHVAGDTRVDGNLIVQGTQTIVNTEVEATTRLEVTNTGTGPAVLVNQTGAQPIADFQDDGVSSLFIADGGNVGIGTNNPTRRLHVAGGSNLTGMVNINNSTGVSQLTIRSSATNNESLEDGYTTLRLENPSYGNNGGSGPAIVFAQQWFAGSTQAVRTARINSIRTIGDGHYGGGLEIYTQPFGDGPMLQRMIINHSGNVGIGTGSPQNTLDVAGSLRLRRKGSELPRFDLTSANGLNGWYIQGNLSDTVNGQFRVRKIVDDHILLSMTNENRVGINTDSPAQALHVVGNTVVTGNLEVSGRINGSRTESSSRTISGGGPLNGWYRIAVRGAMNTSAGGNNSERSSALFIVRDQRSGNHGCIRFVVNQAFGGVATVTIENAATYSGGNWGVLKGIRTMRGGIYAGQVVEVQLVSTSSSVLMDLTITQNDLNGGYTLVNFEPGEVPSGFTAHEIDLTPGILTGVYRDSTPIFNTLSNGRVGIGTANPSQRLQVVGNIQSDSGEFLQNNISIGYGSSTVTDITTTSLNPDKLYNFVTRNTTTTDVRTTEWAARIDGSGVEAGTGIATDSDGNVYVIGRGVESNSITVFNKDSSAFGTLPSSGVFLVKYNTYGNAVWATRIISDDLNGLGISTDSNGNVYITGLYLWSATIFNANGTTFGTVSNSGLGGYGAFIIKYNSSGMCQWTTRVDGSFADFGFGISTDSDGNVYVTGRYQFTTTIFNANGTSFGTLTNATGTFSSFIVKYSARGVCRWATQLTVTGGNDTRGAAIASHSNGNVYVTGMYRGTLTIINSNGTTFGTLANSGDFNDDAAFVVKYDSSGSCRWATRIDGNSIDHGRSITVDANENIYATGFYSFNATIFNANGTTFGTLNSSNQEAYIVKYDASGSCQWATRIGGGSQGSGISSDSYGNVYCTGDYAGTATIFNANGTTFGTLSNSGNSTAFVVKYNTFGEAQWATRIDGTSSEFGLGISTDSHGNVYCTGRYAGTPTIFNPNGTAFGTISTSSLSGAFVVKYHDYTITEIPYTLDLLTNNPSNQGRIVTVINKTLNPSLVKLLNATPQEVSIPISQKFIFHDNKWYPI